MFKVNDKVQAVRFCEQTEMGRPPTFGTVTEVFNGGFTVKYDDGDPTHWRYSNREASKFDLINA